MTSGPDRHDPLAAAEQALVLALAEPERARARAQRLVAGATDPEVRVVARRALGLACKELGDLTAATAHLRAAVRLAEAAGLAERAGQARLSLVPVLLDRGEAAAALAEADRAAAVLRGADADRLLGHRALVLSRCGRFEEALVHGRRAVRRLRAADDPRFFAGLLNNLGLVRAYRGDLARAEADLTRCVAVADRAGLDRLAAMGRANLGFVALRRGDIPRALACYEEAERAFPDAGERAGCLRLDRAATLLAAGLAGEARDLLAATAARLADSGFYADLAEARLLLAQAELAAGEPARAAQTARAARAAFGDQRRTGWALLAEHVEVQARFAAGERTDALLSAARGSARRLTRWGWTLAAAHGHILSGRLALEAGRADLARGELAAVGPPRRNDPAAERIAAWYAAALHRLAAGRRPAGLAALRAGLGAVEAYAAALGAAELRAHAASHGTQIAELGLRLAVESRRPRAVLTWAERWRATAAPPPLRPPRDPALAHELAELRRVNAQLAEAVAEGMPAAALRAAARHAEEKVRRRARQAPGGPRAGGGRVDPRRLTGALGDRALVAWIHLDAALFAVTVADGRCRLHEVGGYRPVARAVATVRFALNRLARHHGGPQSRAAARAGLRSSAALLDDLLFTPLRRAVGDRELVIAPAGALHALPWGALPSTAGRPVTVVPSAAAWLAARAADTPRPGARTVLVAGPGVTHGAAEVATLRATYPDATVLTAAAARADRVRTVLDGADLVHIDAHAQYRPGNAMFSAIDLADGPMFAYDVDGLVRPPRRVVLSACDAGLGDVRAGETVLGLAATFLALGSATLVASVTPVHDAEARTLMAAFHARLVAGAPPARALAEAARSEGTLGFVCFGAG